MTWHPLLGLAEHQDPTAGLNLGGCRPGSGVRAPLCELDGEGQGEGLVLRPAQEGSQPKMRPLVTPTGRLAAKENTVTMLLGFLLMH